MNINNKAGWIPEFAVAKSVIEIKTGLKKDAYYNARNVLKQKGRIDFKERGTRAATFRIISFDSSEKPTSNQISENNLSEKPTRTPTSTPISAQTSSTTSTRNINKLNKTKRNETNTTAADRVNYFDSYMLCFKGQPSPIQIQEINYFIDQEGIEEEAVCIAFKKAAEAGAKYSYARSILNNWVSKGIKTVQDVEEENKAYEQSKKSFSNRRGVVRQEKLPDWYQEPQQAQVVPLPGINPNETYEEKRARLEKMQKQFQKSGS